MYFHILISFQSRTRLSFLLASHHLQSLQLEYKVNLFLVLQLLFLQLRQFRCTKLNSCVSFRFSLRICSQGTIFRLLFLFHLHFQNIQTLLSCLNHTPSRNKIVTHCKNVFVFRLSQKNQPDTQHVFQQNNPLHFAIITLKNYCAYASTLYLPVFDIVLLVLSVFPLHQLAEQRCLVFERT